MEKLIALLLLSPLAFGEVDNESDNATYLDCKHERQIVHFDTSLSKELERMEDQSLVIKMLDETRAIVEIYGYPFFVVQKMNKFIWTTGEDQAVRKFVHTLDTTNGRLVATRYDSIAADFSLDRDENGMFKAYSHYFQCSEIEPILK